MTTDPRAADAWQQLRRALLCVTIAEFCGGRAEYVQCPTCPGCDEGPAMVLPAWQAMCGNDSCPVLMWNPTETAEEFHAKAKELRSTTDESGRITWAPE
jgi:hypothetical protein